MIGIIIAVLAGIFIGIGGFIGLLRLLATDSLAGCFAFIGTIMFTFISLFVLLRILFIAL